MTEVLLNKLIQLHLNKLPAVVTTGTVKDVDEDNYTCTVERGDRPELFKVRLNACEYDGGRFVQVPAIDSVVLVCMVESDPTEGLVIAYSDVDKLICKIGDSTLSVHADSIEGTVGGASIKVNITGIDLGISSMGLKITAGGIVLNGGALGGLPKLSKVSEGLTNIKTYTEFMKGAIATAFQQIPNGGAVASLNFNTAMTGKMITVPDMENKDVKQ